MLYRISIFNKYREYPKNLVLEMFSIRNALSNPTTYLYNQLKLKQPTFSARNGLKTYPFIAQFLPKSGSPDHGGPYQPATGIYGKCFSFITHRFENVTLEGVATKSDCQVIQPAKKLCQGREKCIKFIC